VKNLFVIQNSMAMLNNSILPRIIGILLLLISFSKAQAQNQNDPNITESGDTLFKPPLDDIYDKKIISENNTQYYSHLNERDIMWEKRVMRTIDIKEKRNQTFARTDDGNFELGTNALITILLDEAKKGNFVAYSDENFKNRILDMSTFGSKVDTIFVPDPETGVMIPTPVVNTFNAESIKQYRIKEVWFFDEEQSDIGVRILGFAPVGEIQDNSGIVVSTTTLFWVYYPEIRPILAKHRAFSEASDSEATSWEAIFERRFFSSYIIKESNVHDRRIEHFKSGMDIFYESNAIKDTHFHFEHDQWDY
jgi:gliding motility associated protien GldN